MKNISLKKRGMVLVALPVVFQLVFVFVVTSMLMGIQLELEAGAEIRQVHLELNKFQWKTLDDFLFSGSIDPKNPADQKAIVEAERNRLEKFYNERLMGVSKAYISPAQFQAVRTRVDELLAAIKWSTDKLTFSNEPMTQSRDEVYRRMFKVFPPFLAEMQNLTDANDSAVERSIKKSHDTTERIFQFVSLSILISVTVGGCLGYFFVIGVKRPILHIAEDSQRLSRGEALLPVLEGDAEFASVDQLLHEISAAVKKAQEEERALIENAADLVCSLDVDGTIVEVNSSAQRILGKRKDELIGLKLNEITVPEDSLLADENVRKTILTEGSHTFKLKLKRGEDFVIDTNWSSFWSAAQEKLFCVARDVTEEEELLRMKKDFVDMVSHDLRSPLTSIGITLEIVSSGFDSLPSAALAEVDSSTRNVESLISYINDLLDYQKFDEGQVQLAKTETSVIKLIERAVDNVELRAEKEDIVFSIPEDDFLMVCDSQQMCQVFVKLFANAVRVCPKGSVVEIVATKTEQHARFEVSNPGFEIPADMRSKMFEPYQQESASLHQTGGLSLAVCKMIVDAHAGAIGSAEQSALNGFPGSTFWFTVPLQGSI